MPSLTSYSSSLQEIILSDQHYLSKARDFVNFLRFLDTQPRQFSPNFSLVIRPHGFGMSLALESMEAMLMRDDLISEGFSAWYYAGEYTGASNDCVWQGCYFDDSVDVDGSNYKYAILDLSDMWEGRINGIRLDFAGINSGVPGLNAFDICFLAFFRSTDEAEAYIGEYLGVEIDDNLNKVRGEECVISTPASRVKVVVIPTDEELMIATDTMQILSNK